MVGPRMGVLASKATGRALCLLTALTLVSAVGCGQSPPKQAAKSDAAKPPEREVAQAAAPAELAKRRAQLYGQHCAACHGDKGDGIGLAARFVFPKPRDFRAGRFRLVSTSNGVPTLDDIVAVLERGMPGSSMPPWRHLGDEQVRLLAEHVLALRQNGAKEILLAATAESGDELPPEELQDIVARMTTPSAKVEVPDLGEATAESIAHGKELYVSKACAPCHGETGKGDGQQVMIDSEGLPTRPRDLTRGIFKGNSDPASVWQRIRTGMPGTPMPSSQTLSDAEVTDLTHYVLSMSDQAARDSTVLTRNRITANQVSDLPTTGDAAEWEQVPPLKLRTVPLWWRDDADADLTVQALHDGESICVRLSWADAKANTEAVRSEDFEDAVAVELYSGGEEPFFGMGATGVPIDVWFWDADRQFAIALEDINPDIVVDVDPFNSGAVASAEYDRDGTRTAAQPPVSLTAAAVGNPIVPTKDGPAASSLETAGPGSATFRPRTNQTVDAHGQWSDGRWTVLMRRPLQVSNPADGVSLAPGAKASIAFAVWDGGVKDRDGKKLVTIWQDFELERK